MHLSPSRLRERHALTQDDELGINMTPMIDIVFQLLIFFLLTMRFRDIDRQIESNLPKDSSMRATVLEREVFFTKLKLFRRGFDGDPAEQYTMIKIDNDRREYHLPTDWRGRTWESAARVDAYDSVFRQIESALRKKRAAFPGVPTAIRSEIVAPPPKGGFVPHGDVMRAMDVYLRLGAQHVTFEGKATPLVPTRRWRPEPAVTAGQTPGTK